MDEDEDMLTCMMSAHEDFQQQLGAILLAKDLRGLAKRVVMDGQAEILADRARTVRAALNAWTAVETRKLPTLASSVRSRARRRPASNAEAWRAPRPRLLGDS